MDLKEDAVRNIREVAARVLKPKAKEATAEQAPSTVNRVEGTGNVIGNGNVVYIVGGAANDAPLSESHKTAVDGLISEIVFHETIKRGKPYKAQSVRLHLRKALDLSLRLKDADFERMERYLKGWLARVAAPQPEPGHDEKWRKRRIARILTICKEMDRNRQLEQLLAARYGAAILIELGDEQLNEVFCLVSTWV
jgi:hypothetical protein